MRRSSNVQSFRAAVATIALRITCLTIAIRPSAADGCGLDASLVWREIVDKYMRQQMAAAPAVRYRQRYPALKTLDGYYAPPEGSSLKGADFKGVPPERNVISRNVCVGKWFDARWHATILFRARDCR